MIKELRCRRCGVLHGAEIRRAIFDPTQWHAATDKRFSGSTRQRSWRAYGPVVCACVNAATGLCGGCANASPPAA